MKWENRIKGADWGNQRRSSGPQAGTDKASTANAFGPTQQPTNDYSRAAAMRQLYAAAMNAAMREGQSADEAKRSAALVLEVFHE